MPRKTNCEATILETKWHNSQVHNDAAKLKEIGFVSHDTSADYATAYNRIERKRIFFSSQNRYERWLKQQTDMSLWETTILNQQKLIV